MNYIENSSFVKKLLKLLLYEKQTWKLQTEANIKVKIEHVKEIWTLLVNGVGKDRLWKNLMTVFRTSWIVHSSSSSVSDIFYCNILHFYFFLFYLGYVNASNKQNESTDPNHNNESWTVPLNCHKLQSSNKNQQWNHFMENFYKCTDDVSTVTDFSHLINNSEKQVSFLINYDFIILWVSIYAVPLWRERNFTSK